MSNLAISQKGNNSYTMVSNRFIDEYMVEANDAQIKVYLYLLRMSGAGLDLSVSAIADQFNHTEKDVLRSLKYWEKAGLLLLEYDNDHSLSGIQIQDIMSMTAPVLVSPAPASAVINPVQANPIEMIPQTVISVPSQVVASSIQESRTCKTVPSIPEKPSYSLDDMKMFRADNDAQQLLFVVEQYIGKPLTPSDVKSIIYMNHELKMNTDLIDYLVQYCVEREKKEFRYIEKVACSWYEAGIKTAKEASRYSDVYDKTTMSVLKALGRIGTPTSREVEYINKWKNEYSFSDDMIMEACNKSSLSVEKHRFEYADGILLNWKKNNVRYIADIARTEDAFRSGKSAIQKQTNYSSSTNNKFNTFKQNNYDFSQLEKEILSN